MGVKNPQFDTDLFAGIETAQSGEETRNLRDSIDDIGIRNKLILARINGDKQLYLADGFTRYELAGELGKPFETEIVDFENADAAFDWVDKWQHSHRNQSESQRALSQEIIRRKKRDYAESHKVIPTDKPGNKVTGTSITQHAEAAGVNKPYAVAAATVVEKGSDKLVEMVATGEVDIRKAATIAKRVPKRQQAAAIRDGITTQGESIKDDPKDETGAILGDNLVETFKARTTFDNALEILRQLSALLNPLMGDPQADKKPLPGGEYLAKERQRVKQSIEQIRADLNFARPYAVCPYPHGKGKCTACGGLGYVGKQVYKAAGKGKE